MREDPGSTDARDLVARAAGLLLRCSGFLDASDLASASDDRRCDTYYAVDADVVTMYLRPDDNVRYGTVLGEAQDSLTTRILTFLLGDFLFKSQETLLPGYENRSCRFLLLRPHEVEMFRQLDSIYMRLLY